MDVSEDTPGIFSRIKQCWSRRTKLEGALIITMSIFISLGLGLIATLTLIQLKWNAGDDICNTKGCVKAAASIIKNIDDNIDPCDDFFQFSCGGFLKDTMIPDDKSSATMFQILEDKLVEQVIGLLEVPMSESEPRPFKLAKSFFQSCMNKSLIETSGVQTLREVLQKLGSWPVIQGRTWDSSKFTWYDSVANFRKYGFSFDPFVEFSVITNKRNSSFRVMELDQADLGMRREYFNESVGTKEMEAYLKFQVETAVLLGADRTRAEQEMQAALEFEKKLALISLPREERRNASKLYNPMTITDLQGKYNFVNWLDYIRKLLHQNVSVSTDDTVIVAVPEYLEKFGELISQTDKRVQANYAIWRAVKASALYLGESFRKLQLDFQIILTGEGERSARWRECTNEVLESMSHAIGALYVKNFFNPIAKASMLEMVGNIRAAFLKMLNAIEWMDPKTRDKAMEKALSMAQHIGYPVELLDDTVLDKSYSKLNLSTDNYLQNMLNIATFQTDRTFSKLHEPINKTDWFTHGSAAVVNAYYSWVENSIQFPAGILQGVFFDHERPRYMNYGAIGSVIGHEITHGFDDQGGQFDSTGTLNNWWEPSTAQAYQNRTQCIISQYGNYTASQINLKLNGINTQGENTADNGGFKASYNAYQGWIERHYQEKKLPGLPYTPNQLFWISAANVWCSKFRPETLKQRILTGAHSPGEFRIIGSFSNIEQFSRDFNCPVNSGMNPPIKCSVW